MALPSGKEGSNSSKTAPNSSPRCLRCLSGADGGVQVPLPALTPAVLCPRHGGAVWGAPIWEGGEPRAQPELLPRLLECSLQLLCGEEGAKPG